MALLHYTRLEALTTVDINTSSEMWQKFTCVSEIPSDYSLP